MQHWIEFSTNKNASSSQLLQQTRGSKILLPSTNSTLGRKRRLGNLMVYRGRADLTGYFPTHQESGSIKGESVQYNFRKGAWTASLA